MSYNRLNKNSGNIVMDEFCTDEKDSRSRADKQRLPIQQELLEKPIYLLEHLATFTVNKHSGIVNPADGMRRLLQLEKSTGIWSQKMQLCLDYKWVLIVDYETGNIIERFPATLIQDPTAFTSTDSMDLYNNILVFIVHSGNSCSEMHIFQSQTVSAVHLVEDLKNLRIGKLVTQQRRISTSQLVNQHKIEGLSNKHVNNIADQQHSHNSNLQKIHSIDQFNSNNGETDSECGIGSIVTVFNDEISSTSSDKYERDVTVLNHCFDDIEKFIARLQHAAAASRELERRRRHRKTKKKDLGEGLLSLRTRPPHEKEFMDIFAKFKLSFNLLAKLKAHIHDPNAPELVHFLFTPLALIVEASSDTYYEAQLPSRVVTPLLTREAINLLINCVTSKETELWRSLGDAWIVPCDQWKDEIGSYHPVFMDGWSPDYLIVDKSEDNEGDCIDVNTSEIFTSTAIKNTSKNQADYIQAQQNLFISQQQNRSLNTRNDLPDTIINYDEYEPCSFNILQEKYNINLSGNSNHEDIHHIDHIGHDIGKASVDIARGTMKNDTVIDSKEQISEGIMNKIDSTNSQISTNLQSLTIDMQNLHARETRNIFKSYNNLSEHTVGDGNDNKLLGIWLESLQTADAKIVKVTYPRTANNDKELSVVRGEYLEILDDSRKWWKARNMRGQIAHVPHTIVTPFSYAGEEDYMDETNAVKMSKYAEASEVNETQDRSTVLTEWTRNKHLGKKGEFRYF